MSCQKADLLNIAKDLRKKIFKMIYRAGGGHIAPAFSTIEILTVLYFSSIMKYDPGNPLASWRDRFILSKGHAGSALYAVLAKAGFFNEELLYSYCQEGSILGGHPNMLEIPGVEASTGALGHGLLFGTGVALAGRINNEGYRVYTLLGDGECQEGSVWEAALFAAHHKLGNLTAIVDNNKLQAMDELKNIMEMEPFSDKWRAFGWDVIEVDGHNIPQLLEVFGKVRAFDSKPCLIIAHTIKGKGLSFMENIPIWHNRLPNQEEMQIVYRELEITAEELNS
ncbi:MAG: transketolase [Clostridia bacterium]|nr:transketolase [Clostridia bacterium]